MYWIAISKGFQVTMMRAPTVEMRMPSPTFYAFMLKIAELLVTKPRNKQSETPSNIENPFEKLV
jgi:hypothetical protein